LYTREKERELASGITRRHRQTKRRRRRKSGSGGGGRRRDTGRARDSVEKRWHAVRRKMAKTFRMVAVSTLSNNGQSMPKYCKPVTLNINYDPQGLSIELIPGMIHRVSSAWA
jgi:hypothetical protein